MCNNPIFLQLNNRENMKKLRFSILCMILLSGCTHVTQITTQNGKVGHHINCPYAGIMACYETAGELCGERGYTILDKKDEAGNILLNRNPQHRLLVECKS